MKNQIKLIELLINVLLKYDVFWYLSSNRIVYKLREGPI